MASKRPKRRAPSREEFYHCVIEEFVRAAETSGQMAPCTAAELRGQAPAMAAVFARLEVERIADAK